MKLKKYCSVQRVEFALAMLGAFPFLMLPRTLALRLGEWVGDAMYWCMPHRRAIGLKNLNIAFGWHSFC